MYVTRGNFLFTTSVGSMQSVCLYGNEKGSLVGGYLNTITTCVIYRVVVHWWEGPLQEVPL